MSSKVNYKVFMSVQIGTQGAGRIVFELFRDLTPKTAENFRALCTGQYGKSPNNSKLHYLNTKMHRIIDNFVIQGGDISGGAGKGDYSIYGRTFVDESFARTHSCAGLLSMANSGRNTNASQFFITLKACPHLDGKHVVFGQVIDGMQVVKRISKVPIDKQDRPRFPIVIIDCGQIDNFKDFFIYDPFRKQVFEEIRLKKQKIVRDQHMIRKLLSQDDVDPNNAYEFKKRLEKCEKQYLELEAKQLQLAQDKKKQQQKVQTKEQTTKDDAPMLNINKSLINKLSDKNIDKLHQLRLKLNSAKVLNAKAVLDQEIRQNDVNYHKMIKKQQWLQRQKAAQQELQAKGLHKDKLYMNKNQMKKQDSEKKPNLSFGWNIYGQQAYYKAYEKRCQNLLKNDELYAKQMQGNEAIISNPSQQALERLSLDIQKQRQKRSMFSRRRIQDEDQTVTYISKTNKVYNQKLERSFGKYSSAIKTALQINCQK